MEYVKLGKTDLDVSKICLGCMDLGQKDIYPWHLDEKEGIEYIKNALDLGINFFDTADVYSHGKSEEILGKAIQKYAKRNEVVIATKVFYPVDDSLKRLKMDYVDLYIIHRWDYNTPIEETMCALNDLVKMGKVRYIGASAMKAWQFQKAQYVAKEHGWTQFISMQNHYNLLYREDEREMIPLCQDMNIALTPYSPLAGGRLTRDWYGDTLRNKYDQTVKDKYDANEPIDHPIVDRVGKIAQKKNTTRAMVAMKWLMNQQQVTAPIIGGSKIKYVKEAIQAIDLQLNTEDMKYLEELYQPHLVVGAL